MLRGLFTRAAEAVLPRAQPSSFLTRLRHLLTGKPSDGRSPTLRDSVYSEYIRQLKPPNPKAAARTSKYGPSRKMAQHQVTSIPGLTMAVPAQEGTQSSSSRYDAEFHIGRSSTTNSNIALLYRTLPRQKRKAGNPSTLCGNSKKLRPVPQKQAPSEPHLIPLHHHRLLSSRY